MRKVRTNRGVATSLLYPITADQQTKQPSRYLRVETLHNITPLENPAGVRPDKTVPNPLHKYLFGQPEPSAEEIQQYGSADQVPPMKLYAILEAAKIDTPGLHTLLSLSELAFACLFDGNYATTLRECAPYLVELKEDHAFTRTLFTYNPTVVDGHMHVHLWHKEPGIYLRSRASLQTLTRHFQQFTRLYHPQQDRWTYFRFYAPETVSTIIAAFNQQQFETFAPAIHSIIAPTREGICTLLTRRTTPSPETTITPLTAPYRYADFINETTLQPYRQARIGRYEDKAMTFLRKQFTPATRALNDEQLRQVIRTAYKQARKRGVVTERELLKYLIPVMFWGSYFEEDPQYQAQRISAGWSDEDGKACHNPYVSPLLRATDAWFRDTRTDLEKPRDIVTGFAQIYQKPTQPVSLTLVTRHMLTIWPARTRVLPQTQLQPFIQATYRIARNNNLTGSDSIMYICLAQYFGYRCMDDPLYPWIGAALKDTSSPQEKRRLRLEQSILDYWDSLLEQT